MISQAYIEGLKTKISCTHPGPNRDELEAELAACEAERERQLAARPVLTGSPKQVSWASEILSKWELALTEYLRQHVAATHAQDAGLQARGIERWQLYREEHWTDADREQAAKVRDALDAHARKVTEASQWIRWARLSGRELLTAPLTPQDKVALRSLGCRL